jgi:hypothetical protein
MQLIQPHLYATTGLIRGKYHRCEFGSKEQAFWKVIATLEEN